MVEINLMCSKSVKSLSLTSNISITSPNRSSARKRKKMEYEDLDISQIISDVANLKRTIGPIEAAMKDLASQKRDLVNLKCLIAGLDKKITYQKSNYDELEENINKLNSLSNANSANPPLSQNIKQNDKIIDQVSKQV